MEFIIARKLLKKLLFEQFSQIVFFKGSQDSWNWFCNDLLYLMMVKDSSFVIGLTHEFLIALLQILSYSCRVFITENRSWFVWVEIVFYVYFKF